MTSRTYSVPDISCDHCIRAITDSVGPMDGVQSVEVDIEAKTVTVVGGDGDAIVAAIDEAGYDVAT